MNAISTDPRRWTDLAEENARLRAALEVAQETISAMGDSIGRDDETRFRKAVKKLEAWTAVRFEHHVGMGRVE